MFALSAMHHHNCQFVVAGRAAADGFETYESILAQQTVYLPTNIAQLFQALPEEDFRLDISSTALRTRMQQQQQQQQGEAESESKSQPR